MPSKTRSVENISVRLTIKNGEEHSFADTCAKVTSESTKFLGRRMKKCLIYERCISATSVNLCFLIHLKDPQEAYILGKSIYRQLESARVGIPQEILKKKVTIKAEKCTSTRLAAGLCEYRLDTSAWRELHSLIANEASSVSPNPFILSRTPRSLDPASRLRSLCVWMVPVPQKVLKIKSQFYTTAF